MRKLLKFFSLMYSAYSGAMIDDRIIAEQKSRILYLEDLLLASKGMGDAKFNDFEILAEVQSIFHKRENRRRSLELAIEKFRNRMIRTPK